MSRPCIDKGLCLIFLEIYIFLQTSRPIKEGMSMTSLGRVGSKTSSVATECESWSLFTVLSEFLDGMFFCPLFTVPLFEFSKAFLDSFSGCFAEEKAWLFAFNPDPSEMWSSWIGEVEPWFPYLKFSFLDDS